FLLVAVAILVEVADRVGTPYPVLLVLGGLVLAGVPGLPRIEVEPELILVVFLPPLLFGAAWATPLRDLKANLGPIAGLSISLVVPYVAYLPADQLGLSGVLAAVSAGLVAGRYSATVQTPESRVFAQGAWGIVVFVLNGFAFILLGMELPAILADLSSRSPGQLVGMSSAVSGTVIAARFVWIYVVSFLPGSLRRE